MYTTTKGREIKMSHHDLAGAKWIGIKKGEIQPRDGHLLENLEQMKGKIQVRRNSIIMRREFFASKPIKSATAYICGLGLYTLHINAKRVSDALLCPPQTSYRSRAIYDVIDVTPLVETGENTIVIHLGTGLYTLPEYRWDWRTCWHGNPRAIAKIEIEYMDLDKLIVVTDENFTYTDGPVVESCIYDGEIYDARKLDKELYQYGFDDSSWTSACEVEPPCQELLPNQSVPIRVCGEYEPIRVYRCQEGWLYDFGKNRSGRVSLSVQGKSGERVTLRHCERVFDNGEPDYTTNNGAKAEDVYILCGDGVERYAPEFTYHGFRYAVVIPSSDEMILNQVIQQHIHSDVRQTGTFWCDNPLLMKIHEACTLTQLNCLIDHPIDCPQRDERMGWLGDAHVMNQVCFYNYDMSALYAKWLDDIYCDCSENGEVPHISPWPQRKEFSPVDWSSGYPIIALGHYKMYGDKSILERHYPKFKKYVDYLYAQSDHYLLAKGRYGDWSSSVEGFVRGEPGYANTMFFCYVIQITLECAEILGMAEDVEKYQQMKREITDICIEKYFNHKTKSFGDGTQFSLAFALMLGLYPPQDEQMLVEHLVDHIQNQSDGHLVAGIFGTQYVMDMLRKYDRGDIAVDIMLKEGYPGWLDMLSRNTTLTECWRGDIGSLNHCMLGSVDAQFYQLLGGIQVDMTQEIPVKITPYVTRHCNIVSVDLDTVQGRFVSQWLRNAEQIDYYIQVPQGAKAEFSISSLNAAEKLVCNGVESKNQTLILDEGFHHITNKCREDVQDEV
jgi:alpha-L-rhamnosidase